MAYNFCLWLQVVDLLVSMCRSALESPRKVVIFEPYPSVVDPNDSQALAFNPRVFKTLGAFNFSLTCLFSVILISIQKGILHWLFEFFFRKRTMTEWWEHLTVSHLSERWPRYQVEFYRKSMFFFCDCYIEGHQSIK